MKLSAEKIVLLAKQLQIEELKHLAAMSQFVGVVGHLIHNLQAERGASGIFLASAGDRFADIRLELAAESESVERELRTAFEPQLKRAIYGNARLLHLMAWVLLGLDELPELRIRISEQKLTADDSIAAFSRLIAGLVSLIFEVADSTVDPRISSLLVAFFNLVQGKELAGRERAVGALSFASGICDDVHQQRILHLIDAQERHFQVFGEFIEEQLMAQWQEVQDASCIAQLERMRRMLCNARQTTALDANLSDKWFETCSERLTAIWSIQCTLVDRLEELCASLVNEAESDLQDSEGLLKALREHPPASAELADKFFNPAIPVENALSFVAHAGGEAGQRRSIVDVLQAQSQRLAGMETELVAARRALDERKTIERAKGILMARFNLSEDAAYKRLRNASMEQNRRLADVAEAVLTLAAVS
ncbi:nitrate- and nitrite sensing domain-containing protein [Sideroxydans lithotrophicus]|uniref:ANTAR domain-containing protein n=1 Tax=Sideroxydans lithotrophicus (strain ES-1) TaxID=580332 RepID=D5CU61_SIDLE|nr:nitrate- and nitrite sensing domain-containing protein [Sideroxydans lithotrophicus]ADE10396.1 ANTAR domain protein with unknown sensor [Sideroxydans lithotrophicus ES-1]